ncbi:PLAT/LH2 domain-containing protein [Nocardia gipuzkoensis]
MTDQRKAPYLFLLARPSAAARREAVAKLRELGATVVAQFPQVAVEALATAVQAEAIAQLGMFSAQLKGPMKQEHLEALDERQRDVVSQWNTRFTSDYRQLRKDSAHVGKSWGDAERQPPHPFTFIDPRDFLALLTRYEQRTGVRVTPSEPRQVGLPVAEEFIVYEQRLAGHLDDPSLAYHLSRLAFQLGPQYMDLMFVLPEPLIEELTEILFGEAACWKMTGEMAVGIVFVESSRTSGPRFTATERRQIRQEIFDGLSWLASQHPEGDLSWIYDTQFVTIDIANGSGDPAEDYWRDPAMGEVDYNGNTYDQSWTAVADYREDMRVTNAAEHAFVIFVTPYANEWHAYAAGGRVTLAEKDDWGGWGRASLDTITAHESSHLFGAADEYSGRGTPCSSCATTHGCDKIPNGNCGTCARPQQRCVMDRNFRRLCGYTRAQIGWSSLFVELTTDDVARAGTDDDVWVDIGDHEFELDTPDHDDRERNNREGYPIWNPHLRRSDIKRILIRKSPDGAYGGWKLRRIRAWFAGELVCERDIDRWLEDDHRFWVGCREDEMLVNSLRVKITTGDLARAGTDDDVTLTLAGRSWELDNVDRDDFERGRTDTFDLDPGPGLYGGDIHSVRIHKSRDGAAGGWRLKGVEVIVNGTTIFTNQSIDKWLENDDRTWTSSV